MTRSPAKHHPPGRSGLIKADDLDLDHMRRRLIENQVKGHAAITGNDLAYLIAETNADETFVKEVLKELNISIGGSDNG